LTAGAHLVRDINVSGDSVPYEITPVGNVAFFAATGPGGRELWKTDGTEAGTVRVKNIRPGSKNSYPSELTPVGGLLYFAATGELGDRELWVSDGTSAGTHRVKNINPAGSSEPFYLANVNGTLFFSAHSAGGRELWKSDGTAAGTVRVKDLVPGAGSSSPEGIIAVGDLAFFTAFNSADKYQVWRSDGTWAGTFRLPGQDPYDGARNLIRVGDRAYFLADLDQGGCSLESGYYRTDGTNTGTFFVTDEFLEDVPTASLNNRFLYGPGEDLRRINASETGSVLVKHLANNGAFENNPVVQITRVGQRLFLMVDVYQFNGGAVVLSHRQLWKSDGSKSGTKVVFTWDYPIFNDPLMTNVGGELFFALPGIDGLSDIWRSNGTTAGTMPVVDIGSDYPLALYAGGGSLYFDHDDGIHGRELWSYVP
jgi:ELWxxDGT repeat protein